MDNDDFYIDHHVSRMLVEAVMYGFRISGPREFGYSSSPDLSPIRKRSISPEGRKREVDVLPCERFQGKRVNYTEIAEQNAQELIKEEEQAKMKAEKKRAKKERQKQRRKVIAESTHNNCSNNENVVNNTSKDMENLVIHTDNKEAEGLDVHAAFMSKAVKKVKSASIISEETKPKKEEKDINSIITIALEYENKEQFKEAVHYFSEAINLAPKRYDLILKRSFSYYQLAKFEKSLRDAQKVLQYSSNNTEGYYRIGEAYFALNNLPGAETAFTKLLSLNSFCDAAKKRLFSVRIKQLEEMGYHPNEAFTALLKSKNKTLDEAIEFLNALENGKETTEDLYYSDEDELEEEDEEEDNGQGTSCPSAPAATSAAKPKIVIDKKSPLLMDPSNPLGCCSLFVGNLKKDITYEEVNNVFVKFGEIKSIKLMTDPNCYTFINYEESEAAGRAMEALQSSRWLLSTMPLLIKYPTKIINKKIPNLKYPEVILSKFEVPSAKSAAFKLPVNKPIPVKTPVQHPPVADIPLPLGEECYFWRTTGCVYGNKCFNLHIPEHRGNALNLRKPLH